MDAATRDIVQNRVKPILDEVMDAYVIVGFRTDADGVRRRCVIGNLGARNKVRVEGMGDEPQDIGPKDAALQDAMEPVLAMAREWNRKP